MRSFRILGFLAGVLPGLALGLGKIHVENAKVGERTLILTVDDSILDSRSEQAQDRRVRD